MRGLPKAWPDFEIQQKKSDKQCGKQQIRANDKREPNRIGDQGKNDQPRRADALFL